MNFEKPYVPVNWGFLDQVLDRKGLQQSGESELSNVFLLLPSQGSPSHGFQVLVCVFD